MFVFTLCPTSFKDVILLVPVANSERESIKSNSKIPIVESINEWVDGAIHPAKPKQKLLQNLIRPNAILTYKRSSDIMYEERQPARYKTFLDVKEEKPLKIHKKNE